MTLAAAAHRERPRREERPWLRGRNVRPGSATGEHERGGSCEDADPHRRGHKAAHAALLEPPHGGECDRRAVSRTSLFETGGAVDPEDGQVWGTSMLWTGDRDGVLYDGRSSTRPGSAFHWESLTVGRHVVTLTATDQRGATGRATVTITVTP